MYSFIRPKPKSIFKRYTKVWIFYTLLAVAVICGFAKVLERQVVGKINEQAKLEQNTQNLKLKTIAVKDYIERLNYEIKLGGDIQTQNQMLKEGVSNLLKLIPDQITARSIELNYNALTMRGITPSREVYKFLLEAPLRAVFTQTRVEFYPLSSGWFNFVSVSRADPTLKPLNSVKKDKNEQ